MGKEAFPEDRFGGLASHHQEEVINGPKLQLPQKLIALGIFTDHWQISVPIKNAGTAPLSIKAVTASCPCVTVDLNSTMMEPQQESILSIKGTQDRSGEFTHTILISTNESDRPNTIIPLRGYLEPPILLDQPALTLEMAFGERIRTEVGVEVAPGLSEKDLAIIVPKEAPVSAAIEKGEGRFALAIQWKGSDKPGWHHHTIALKCRAAGYEATTRLLLAVKVRPLIEVYPPSVLIRDEELSEDWTRQLVFKTSTKQQVGHLAWADPFFDRSIKAEISKQRPDDFVVQLRPARLGALSDLAGKRSVLSFSSPGGITCEVKVYVGVRSPLEPGAQGRNALPRLNTQNQ